MVGEVDLGQIRRLQAVIDGAALYSRHPPKRYDAGHVFDLAITGVCPAAEGRAKLRAEAFVGGGFAGQVYRCTLTDLDVGGRIPGLEVGGTYAVKILIPPSGLARRFRDALYWLGYQGAFSAQVNAAAARTGALWQKLIRRGARARLGDERCVRDVCATFFEPGLGSYGEISEWVEGRTWRFEIDDELFDRRRRAPDAAAKSAEYLAKKKFMADLVRLFHDMGAPELARQYEWWSLKSQPNVMKRFDAGDGPGDGLTALDFRAGLALLSFLPMSPVDVRLIGRGLRRGRLVQFDQGDLGTLEAFCDAHAEAFADLRPALDELKRVDPDYRASLLGNHDLVELLLDRSARQRVKDGLVEGWRVKRLVDEEHAERLRRSSVLFPLFWLAGCLPFVGKHVRRLWGSAAWRRHVTAFFTSFDYLRRTFRAAQAECLIDWYRANRVGERGIKHFLKYPTNFWCIRVFPGMLPLPLKDKWFRPATDWRYAWEVVRDWFRFARQFYRDAEFREAWLTREVERGCREGMLTAAEKDRVLARVPDPFIQKYLKCLAVHLCTLPITQIVSVAASVWAGVELDSALAGAAVLVGFQFLVISPGSLVRGTYVVYLMIKERNWRNYWLALIVSYWHYVGYLGFPLQMVKEFPTLSRLMAGEWATKMTGIIPVFGERGALLEHWIFDLFFNVPLSIKRRLRGGR